VYTVNEENTKTLKYIDGWHHCVASNAINNGKENG
jgi:hypothetical protein